MMNPGMALGIAAAQLAQQGQYKPFTSDGKPTVVNNLITQESQKEAAKQAQTAASIQMMREQEMQQALKQMLAQRTQPPGIEGLQSNLSYADGGVVGYAGPNGSQVKNQAEEDRERIAGIFNALVDKGLLPAGAAIADVATAIPRGLAGAYNSTVVRAMRAAGLPAGYIPDIAGGDFSSATPFYDRMVRGKEEAPPTPSVTPRPMSDAELARLQEANVAPTGMPAAPAPRPQPRPQTAAPAQMLPDTRESTAVNPSESALMYAQMQGGLKDLFERQNKPRELTPAELKEAAAREEELRRRMGEIDASKGRFEQAKQERLASQEGQGMRDLASFLSRAGGARSGLAGLGQATLGMEPIFAARAAQEQKFRDQELAFMDKLGERRDLVSDMRLSSLKDDSNRAREDAARLRTLDMELSKLGLGLGEKRAGELARAELSREEFAARAKEGALDRASRERMEGARLKQQAEQNGQMALANRINASNITVSSAIEKMDRDLEKRFGTTIKMYQMMKPEDIQKQPALAAGYQQYIQEREKIYRTSVEPAVRERDRLAAMINSGQDLSKWGEPTVKTGG